MKNNIVLLSVFMSSCVTKESSSISSGTQRYISPPGIIGCKGYRYYSPVIGSEKHRYVWKTKLNHVFDGAGESGELWMFKLSFLRDGKRFSLPNQRTKCIEIRYTITDNLDKKSIDLASKLNEWFLSESSDSKGGAIYWPDYLQNKRLQKECQNIKFDLESDKEYNIIFEVDVSRCENFPKDTKCLVELGFGGFL